MVSSMGDNAGDGEVVNMLASMARYVDDNGGMICGAEVSGGSVEYLSGMEVSSVERLAA